MNSRQIVLRSGTDKRRIMRTSVFLRTWQRSGFWAVTTLNPGELPADPDRDRYVEAAAGLEQTGHYRAARDAGKPADYSGRTTLSFNSAWRTLNSRSAILLPRKHFSATW
jgi:hypothetical protein